MSYEDLNPGERALVDWQYRGDNFNALLCMLISKADIYNRQRLALSFPDEVRAVTRFQNEDGYWDDVLRRLEK